MKIKDDFHRFIDSIEDEELLKNFYHLMQNLNNGKSTHLWDELNEDQRKELLMAYEESFNDNNLLSHQQVKSQHEKWLKP